MTESSVQLPPLYFAKCGGFTYARTYRNVWVPKKRGQGKTAVKTDIRKAGRIDSPDGIGVVNFDREFLELHPELRNCTVVRVHGENRPFELKITSENGKEVRPPCITVRSTGATLVLDRLLSRDPLLPALKEAFPESWELILSFAYYMVMEPDAKASRLGIFAQEVKLPYTGDIYPSKVTRLLESLTESGVDRFFRLYLKRLTTGRHLSRQRLWAVDSTSISTYAKLNDARYGKNKQEENLPQLNVMYVTDETTGRPLYYQVFNGSVPDMASCVTVFEMLLNLGVHSFIAVADRGFFSENNIAFIQSRGYHYVMCVPSGRCTSYQKFITEAQSAMARDNLYSLRCDEEVYTSRETVTFCGRKAFVHVFFDKWAAGEQAAVYQRRLKQAESDYLGKKTLTAETVQFLTENYLNDGGGNFERAENGRLILNKKAFQETINSTGIFIAVSDTVKDAVSAFLAYRERRKIEDNFSTLKDRMKMKRIRVSTEESLSGKCFIQFLAVTLNSLIDRVLWKIKSAEGYSPSDLPHHSVGSMLDELRGIREVYFSDTKNHVISPVSARQRACLEVFKVKVPVSHYEEGLARVNAVTEAPKPHGEGLKKG